MWSQGLSYLLWQCRCKEAPRVLPQRQAVGSEQALQNHLCLGWRQGIRYVFGEGGSCCWQSPLLPPALPEGISFHNWEVRCCAARLCLLRVPPFLPTCALLKTLNPTSAASRTSPASCSTGHVAACPAWLRVGTEGPLERPSETKVQTKHEDRGIARLTGCAVPGKTSQPPAQPIGSWERSLDKGY